MIVALDPTATPDAPRIKNVQPGTVIEASDVGTDGCHGDTIKWTVIKVYKHVVLAHSGQRRRCFSYGDLRKEGLE